MMTAEELLNTKGNAHHIHKMEAEILMEEYATSKSNEDNKLLLEEIETLRFNNKNQAKTISDYINEMLQAADKIYSLESQLAEAKKEIVMLERNTSNAQDAAEKLQSQLQESEERNKQMVEALEEYKVLCRSCNKLISVNDINKGLIMKIKEGGLIHWNCNQR